MQNMFKNKGVKTTKKPFVVDPKVVNPLVHVVDLNMAITKSKVIEEQMFKYREPIKKKFATHWKEKHKLHESFVKTIQDMQAKDPPQSLNQKGKT
jgi:hypothetical protein